MTLGNIDSAPMFHEWADSDFIKEVEKHLSREMSSDEKSVAYKLGSRHGFSALYVAEFVKGPAGY